MPTQTGGGTLQTARTLLLLAITAATGGTATASSDVDCSMVTQMNSQIKLGQDITCPPNDMNRAYLKSIFETCIGFSNQELAGFLSVCIECGVPVGTSIIPEFKSKYCGGRFAAPKYRAIISIQDNLTPRGQMCEKRKVLSNFFKQMLDKDVRCQNVRQSKHYLKMAADCFEKNSGLSCMDYRDKFDDAIENWASKNYYNNDFYSSNNPSPRRGPQG